MTVEAVGGNVVLHLSGFEKEGFGHTQGTKRLSVHERAVVIATSDFDEFWAVIREILKTKQVREKPEKYICLDGMPCTCLVREENHKLIFEGNSIAGDVIHELCKAVVLLAWKYLDDDVSCELLGNLAIYIEVKLPEKKIISAKPMKRIVIFGSEEDHRDLREISGETEPKEYSPGRPGTVNDI